MTYTPAATRTWTRLSDNDGLVFNVEYRRIDANISEMMDGLDKSADYTILAGDKIGLLRVTNAVTKETTKAFSAATPSVVSDVTHGLVTGDTIVVSGSTVETEVGNIHYTVIRINDDTFSLNGTVNAGGGGGNLDWRKDVEITLPAAASHTDNIYTVMKVDANEGAVKVTDGTKNYFLQGENEIVTLKSDGTDWIEIDLRYTDNSTEATQQVVAEHVLGADGLDYTATFNAVGVGAAEFVKITQLPQNTIEVLIGLELSLGGAESEIGMDFSLVGVDAQNISFIGSAASVNWRLSGTYWIKTRPSGEFGNDLRMKKKNANVVVSEAHILAYKTERRP